MAQYRRKDHYYKKAKKEGYLSRAAYKLAEINETTGVLKGGDYIVDVGCAPGGWSQVALEIAGPAGRVVGLDILDTCSLKHDNFTFLHLDISNTGTPEAVLKALGRKADAIISDAAPNTTGIKFTDQARSVELVNTVLAFSHHLLAGGGNFLAKMFEGPDTDPLLRSMKALFKKVKRERPRSTRKGSKETYIIGIGFKGKPGDR